MKPSASPPSMPENEHPASRSPSSDTAQPNRELHSLATGPRRESFRQILAKPLTIVASVMCVVIIGLVFYLQQDPAALTLERPEAQYELLPNNGLTDGVPIAIQLGPLTVFEISDPLAGGSGAARAREVVDSLNTALSELEETPGRFITIESNANEGLPSIVQKASPDSVESLLLVQVTSDDMALAQTDDAKLLARVWAERITDSFRLLLFGEPPEFSRDTAFGGALDTLYVNARAESGKLTTETLSTAFEELPESSRQALTSFPALPSTESSAGQG